MYSDLTGIILAGGKSSRMGANKSFLKLGNKTIIERTADLMKSVFENVIIITNTPTDYDSLELPTYEDIYKLNEPIAGIHCGLVNSKTEKNYFISCDMPLMTKETIDFILNYKTTKPITVARADGFVQQLCGVYSKKVLPEIIKLINEKKSGYDNKNKNRICKVLQLVKRLDAEIIPIETEFKGYEEGMFFNMNRPEEFEYIKERLALDGFLKSYRL